MAVVVESYVHRTGEHCASTALRNILAHDGTELSEGMVFGLASGLGFYYLESAELSPTRMFHGRTASLESDFGRNTGVPIVDRPEADDARALQILRERIDRGIPVMVSTDTYYLPYHDTRSHFPGHRCVIVGYDDALGSVLIADRKFEEVQRCSYEDLRRARNAPDHPRPCGNQYGDLEGRARLGWPLEEAIRSALRRNAHAMLEPEDELPAGIPAMRTLAQRLPDWKAASDWSWSARFGYQVIVKRGAGGSCFRSLFADFLREAAPHVAEIARALPAERMDAIAARWRALAALLEAQSGRAHCDPGLFSSAGRIAAELAAAEERFFSDALRALGDGD
jgi:hypothetical protein